MALREPQLLDGMDCASTLAEAAVSGQRDGAVEMARLLDRRQQVCLHLRDLRCACMR